MRVPKMKKQARTRARGALSLERKLPLLITTLLVSTMAMGVIFAYAEVKQTALGAAAERLRLVAGQLSDLIGPTLPARRTVMRRDADDPAVLRYLDAPVESNRAQAAAALRSLRARNDSTYPIVLRAPDGRPMLVLGRSPGLAPADSGRLSVADATNLEPVPRQRLLEMARELGRPAVAIVLDVPPDVARARNLARARTVPPHVLDLHYERFRAAREVLATEGFTAIHEVQPGCAVRISAWARCISARRITPAISAGAARRRAGRYTRRVRWWSWRPRAPASRRSTRRWSTSATTPSTWPMPRPAAS